MAWMQRRVVYRYQDGDSAAAMPDKFNDALLESKDIYDLLKTQKKTENACNADHPPYIHIKTNEPSPTVKLHHYYENEENAADIW
jgi:hypothetical protein